MFVDFDAAACQCLFKVKHMREYQYVSLEAKFIYLSSGWL